MITDSVQILESLEQIIDYNWKDELRNFEETFEIDFPRDTSVEDMLKVVQLNKNMKNHIFYHLLVLKSQILK